MQCARCGKKLERKNTSAILGKPEVFCDLTCLLDYYDDIPEESEDPYKEAWEALIKWIEDNVNIYEEIEYHDLKAQIVFCMEQYIL